MFDKTTAIALRISPFSRTSLVVNWLTRDKGRLTTMVKGALRPKSDFLGQFDLFYTCEIVFYSRDFNHLHILRECAIDMPRTALRSTWRACAAASYLCDLVWRISPPSEPAPETYDLLSATLDLLARHQSMHTLISWFELKLLQATGLAPQLQQCPVCGKRTLEQEGSVRLALLRGGVLCGKCSAGDDFQIMPLAPDALRIMRTWQNAETPQLALRITCSPRQQMVISRILGAFLEYHLETAPSSRDIAFGLMNTTVPEPVTH